MAEIVYALCAFMSVICAIALFRGHQKTGGQLLLWSSVSFGILAVNNVFLFYDLVIVPEVDLNGIFWRSLMSALAGASLLFGLIWELT